MTKNISRIQPTTTELGFQMKAITTVIRIAIIGAALFFVNSLFVYYRKGLPQSLTSASISAALLLVGFFSLWLIKQGKFQLARKIFLFAYFLRVIQLMLVIPENLFPISVMYMTVFVILSIFLSNPKSGFTWIALGITTTIAIVLIRPFTDFPLTAIQDPVTHGLAIYFLPLVSLGTISILCVYIYHQFHKTLLESLDARQRLEQSNKTLENFAYVASHDLQEPLRTITCYTQLLEQDYKEKLDKDADNYMQFILEGAQRMRRLIQDLLLYSRTKTQKVSFETTSLNESMAQALKNLKSVIEETGAILKIDDLPVVTAYPVHMTQLFQNLIGNSIKFRSDQVPQIEITVKSESQRWLFALKDNGIGINPENQKKVFELFQRLHSQQKYQGSGMGLSIAEEIVTHHNGRIWVESEFGKGSTFFFTLPSVDLPPQKQEVLPVIKGENPLKMATKAG